MPSETDLLNDALGQIGATPIGDILEGSPNANYCLRFYPSLRDGLLRMHHWNFATRRATLALREEKPVFGYAYSYALPADFMKIIEYNHDHLLINPPFRIEGHNLVTNDSPVQIVYLARVIDPNQYDVVFYQICTTWLASKLAMAIAKDSTKAQDLLNIALTVLMPMAMSVDGQEGNYSPDHPVDLYWGR